MDLKETLRLAWENRDKIAEGFYNKFVSHKQEILQEAQRRQQICESNICGYYDAEGKPKTSAIQGKPACSICHCNIVLKVNCMSCFCALKDIQQQPLWEELIDTEMDKHIGQTEYENQFKQK